MGEGEREIGKWILRESINNKVDKKPKEGEGANFFFFLKRIEAREVSKYSFGVSERMKDEGEGS